MTTKTFWMIVDPQEPMAYGPHDSRDAAETDAEVIKDEHGIMEFVLIEVEVENCDPDAIAVVTSHGSIYP